jgi:hypothetical protein
MVQISLISGAMMEQGGGCGNHPVFAAVLSPAQRFCRVKLIDVNFLQNRKNERSEI